MSLQNGDFVVYFFEGGEYMTICNFYSGSEAETESFAQKFAEKLKHGDLVAFFGDLGAGKTAFVRGAVSYLCPEALVCSPTYAVINEYKGAQNTVCHFDLYRIHGEDDLLSIGFDDYFDSDKIIFTEWSENAVDFLPLPRYEITITKIDSEARSILVERKE